MLRDNNRRDTKRTTGQLFTFQNSTHIAQMNGTGHITCHKVQYTQALETIPGKVMMMA